MRESRLKLAAGYIALLIVSVMFIVPFVWLLRSSVMDLSQIFIMPPAWCRSRFTSRISRKR